MIQLDRFDVMMAFGALFGTSAAIEAGGHVEPNLLREVARALLHKWGYTPEEARSILDAGIMRSGMSVDLRNVAMWAKHAVAAMIAVPQEIEAGRLDASANFLREAASGILLDAGHTADEIDILLNAKSRQVLPPEVAADLIRRCCERCCICHRGKAQPVVVVHIVPIDEGGSNSSENAIVVCHECRGEIYLRSVDRGITYSADELRRHRDQWLEMCGTL